MGGNFISSSSSSSSQQITLTRLSRHGMSYKNTIAVKNAGVI